MCECWAKVILAPEVRAGRGGVSNGGGGSRLVLPFFVFFCPFLSFFVLFCPFWDFPDFSEIFLICPGIVQGFSRLVLIPLSRKTTCKEQSRKGPRHNLDLARKNWAPPPVYLVLLSGPQKGPADWGPHRKTSKIIKKCENIFRHFSTLFDTFRTGQKTSKVVKKCQKSCRQFSRSTNFPAPFGGFWFTSNGSAL